MELFAGSTADGVTVVLVTHTSQLVHYGTRAMQMAGGVLVEARL